MGLVQGEVKNHIQISRDIFLLSSFTITLLTEPFFHLKFIGVVFIDNFTLLSTNLLIINLSNESSSPPLLTYKS